jgi:hypothetical protein
MTSARWVRPAVVALLAALAGYASTVVVRGEAQKIATARRLLGQAQQLYGQKRRRAEAVRLYSQALPPHLAPAPLLPEGWVKGWTQLAGELTVAHVRVGSAMEESAKSATGGPESDEALGSYKSAIGHYSAAAAGMQRSTASQPGQGGAGMEQPVLEALVDLLCAEDRYVGLLAKREAHHIC